jgi:predicted metal-dependent enzyme (double-stranded beta helix superfamily)
MKTVHQLIQKIKTTSQESAFDNAMHLHDIMKEYNAEDWKKVLNTNDGKPVNTILLEDDCIKLLLIYWAPGQRSSKHGHPPGGGIIKLLSGSLKETLFDPKAPEQILGVQTYTPGKMAYIHDSIALHIVENLTDSPSVSLHVYVKSAARTNSIQLVERQTRLAA